FGSAPSFFPLSSFGSSSTFLTASVENGRRVRVHSVVICGRNGSLGHGETGPSSEPHGHASGRAPGAVAAVVASSRRPSVNRLVPFARQYWHERRSGRFAK